MTRLPIAPNSIVIPYRLLTIALFSSLRSHDWLTRNSEKEQRDLAARDSLLERTVGRGIFCSTAS